MNRDDLRVVMHVDDTGPDRLSVSRPVSDAELAEMGYIKLPQSLIDRAASIVTFARRVQADDVAEDVGHQLAKIVLAAIDKGDTDV